MNNEQWTISIEQWKRRLSNEQWVMSNGNEHLTMNNKPGEKINKQWSIN